MNTRTQSMLSIVVALVLAAGGSTFLLFNRRSEPPSVPRPQQKQVNFVNALKPSVLAIKAISQPVDSNILPLIFDERSGKVSLAKRIVGPAEGTRTEKGLATSAFQGHRDPMCQFVECGSKWVTNIGTFSYQQSPTKPNAHNAFEADRIQSEILRAQALELIDQASKRGLKLTLFQLAAGIDLANQSPSAACVQQPAKSIIDKLAAGTDRKLNTTKIIKEFKTNTCTWGYIDRLKQAVQSKKLVGFVAVVEARKWSFFSADPSSSRYGSFDASGFGNDPAVIEADQARRTMALAGAIHYHIEHASDFR